MIRLKQTDLPDLAQAIVLALRNATRRNKNLLPAEKRKLIRSGTKAHAYYLERLSDRRYLSAVRTNSAIMGQFFKIKGNIR